MHKTVTICTSHEPMYIQAASRYTWWHPKTHSNSQPPSQIFSGIFIFFGLGSRYAFLFLKKLRKNKIEYTGLRSKCSRIYSDTKLTAKQYHLEVILISE